MTTFRYNNDMEKEKYYSIQEAAKYLGKTRQAIYKMISSGRLRTCENITGFKAVKESDIKLIKASS